MDRFYPNAIEALKSDANGTPILSLATSGPGGRANANINTEK